MIPYAASCSHENCLNLHLHDDTIPFWMLWEQIQNPKAVARAAKRSGHKGEFALPTPEEASYSLYGTMVGPRLEVAPGVKNFISLYGTEHIVASIIPPTRKGGLDVHLSFSTADYAAKFAQLAGGFGTKATDAAGKLLAAN